MWVGREGEGASREERYGCECSTCGAHNKSVSPVIGAQQVLAVIEKGRSSEEQGAQPACILYTLYFILSTACLQGGDLLSRCGLGCLGV